MDFTSIIGFVAAAGTAAANVPQVLKTWRTGDTGDLSLKMLAILTASLAIWAVYGLMRADYIIVVSNLVSSALAGYLLAAKLRE